jgi:hypothetical protein|nr:hypothetical protein [Ferrimicrobium acidiphilum]
MREVALKRRNNAAHRRREAFLAGSASVFDLYGSNTRELYYRRVLGAGPSTSVANAMGPRLALSYQRELHGRLRELGQ